MLKFSTEDCPKKMQIVLLSVIVTFAAVLRFWNLGQWSFWIDEVFSVRDAQNLSFGSFRSIPNPIPYLAVKLSISIGGNSEWGSRLIPCLVGIISIPAVFGLGRTLYNWRVGLFSSAFVACASWHLFWAQNARYPVFTFLFAVLTAWCFYLSLERDSTLLMIGALVCCLCLILSHTLSVVIVPALAVYALICLIEKPSRKRWLNLLIFFIPFAIPVFALVLPEVRGYLFSGWGRNEWQRSLFYIILTLVQGVSVPIAVTAFFGCVVPPFNKPTRFFTVLRWYSVSTFLSRITVPKRRGLLPILDNLCLLHFRRSRVRTVVESDKRKIWQHYRNTCTLCVDSDVTFAGLSLL